MLNSVDSTLFGLLLPLGISLSFWQPPNKKAASKNNDKTNDCFFILNSFSK